MSEHIRPFGLPATVVITMVGIASLAPRYAHAQASTSDCEGAIQLCGGVYTETAAPPGTGNVYEFTGVCNASVETSSLWYTFTVQSDGNLSFILDPANPPDDYDWGLFNITNGGCAGIIAQDGSSPEVSCNSYGTLNFDNGPTGISTASGGSGNSNGPGDLNGPPFNADLAVQTGQTYALVVMNWTNSPYGYTIDFTSSTASLFDDIDPYPVSVEADCANQNFHITFSEPVITTSVQPADFTITSPQGQTTGFSTVTPDDPNALQGAGYTITLPAGLQDTGTYVLTVTFISGNVEDGCGNVVVDTTFQVTIGPPLQFEVEATSACNSINGSLTAQYISGGLPPVAFALNGQTMVNGSAGGLQPGAYTLTATDAEGCVLQQQVTVPDQLLNVIIAAAQDSITCLRPAVAIQGVEVLPAQAVQYQWTAVTPNGTDTAFSTSPSPQITVPGIYQLAVVDPVTGCAAGASVEVFGTSVPAIDPATIVFPNVISPNGDGLNDRWRPYIPTDPERDLSALFREFSFSIFNRWGQRVAGAEGNAARRWDGRDVPAGTYFYKVAYKATCGPDTLEERQGTITLLR